MNQKAIKAAQREQAARIDALATRICHYIDNAGPNTPRVLELLEIARKRRDNATNH